MKRIAVGLSGGVDSAVSAALLVEKGFDVEGIFMKNWDEESELCTAEQDYKDALQVCDLLNIPLHTVNFSKEYWNFVFEHFLKEYKSGRTPNPDILCNTEIKFKEFLNYCIKVGAELIATGHYVRSNKIGETQQILKGHDKSKDQSYFLHGLRQQQISHSIFPLGKMKKSEVRAKAKALGFSNFDKKDSVGICFIGEKNIKDFLKKYIPEKPGDIINIDGEMMGQHDGIMYYTIGQRKGLGIGGRPGEIENEGWYVVEKDLTNNQLIVCQGNNNPALYNKKLSASNINWISGHAPKVENIHAKIRYRSQDKPCKIIDLDDRNINVIFDQPQFAIAPGQSIVFYDGDICLGGAVIDSHSK